MPSSIRRFYADLTQGYAPTAPPRALDPGAGSGFIWRDALNVIDREGVLVRRAALQASGLGLNPKLLAGSADDTETPIAIFAVSGLGAAGAAGTAFCVVTNRMLWLRTPAGTWFNVTPTYAAGTITATNGSPNITGAGTQWQTLGITAGAVILIGSAYYQLASVTSDTAAALTTNFGEATGGGKAYTIYRCFPGGSVNVTPRDVNNVFATVFTNNLYVAGTYCGTSTSATPVPAVIKVSNIFTSPFTTYLTASATLQAGLDTNSSMTRICGLKNLQDGRIVVAGAQNTIFYSSNLNDAVWTVSPGGESLIALINGRMNALGQIGAVYTLHHNDGVALAYPTGLSDPPLRYQASNASQGVFAPRTLKTIDGAEYGLAADGSVLVFDLNRSDEVGEELRPALSTVATADADRLHASVDQGRHEYTLYSPTTTGTTFWTYQARRGRWWPGQMSVPLGAMSDAPVAGALNFTVRGIAGLWTIEGAAESASAALPVYKEGVASDSVTYSGYTASRFYVTTDDLDFGEPMKLKGPLRLILWGQRLAAGTIPILVSVSRDQGVNWTTVASQNWPATLSAEAALQFSFDPLTPGAGHSLRFRVEINTTSFLLELRRMVVEALESATLEPVEL